MSTFSCRSQNKVICAWKLYQIAKDVGEAGLNLHTFPRVLVFIDVSLMYINDLLHLIVATQKYSRPVVDMFGHYRKHALHAAVDRLTTSYATRLI